MQTRSDISAFGRAHRSKHAAGEVEAGEVAGQRSCLDLHASGCDSSSHTHVREKSNAVVLGRGVTHDETTTGGYVVNFVPDSRPQPALHTFTSATAVLQQVCLFCIYAVASFLSRRQTPLG